MLSSILLFYSLSSSLYSILSYLRSSLSFVVSISSLKLMPRGSLPYFTRESKKSLPRCQRYQVWIVVLLLRSIVQKWSSYPSLHFKKNEQGIPPFLGALGEPWMRSYLLPVLMFLMYMEYVSWNSSMKQLLVSGTM